SVASHILIGILVGLTFALLGKARLAFSVVAVGQELPLPASLQSSLPGLRDGLAALIKAPIEGTFLSFVFLALLVLVGRGLALAPGLRRSRLGLLRIAAQVVAVALFGSWVVLAGSGPWPLALAVAVVQVGLASWVATRFGVLALVATFTVVEIFDRFPLTLDPGDWYFGLALLAGLAMVTLIAASALQAWLSARRSAAF
ncbi:MAG: hypothetical protein AAGE94_01655, partial [Acidobacteriota bacterium]